MKINNYKNSECKLYNISVDDNVKMVMINDYDDNNDNDVKKMVVMIMFWCYYNIYHDDDDDDDDDDHDVDYVKMTVWRW